MPDALLALLLALQAAAPAPPPDATAAAAQPSPAEFPQRARPVQPLFRYFSFEDYPRNPAGGFDRGTVSFRVSIGADGAPTGCEVAESSGSAVLDETTCRLALERFRFVPARDAAGRAVPDSHFGRIQWRTAVAAEADEAAEASGPASPAAPPRTGLSRPARPAPETMRYGPESWPKTDRAGAVTLSLHVTPEGRAERCTVARPSPWPEIDARFCAFALRRFRFEPALDSAGRPVADIVDFRFDFKPPS